MTIQIYQTLEDRNNPQEIESKGPFRCNKTNAWLGKGYYFWEHYVDHAHWWGQKGWRGKYIICSALYDKGGLYCLDLIDNYEHLEFLKEIYIQIQEKTKKPIYVPKLIELLKNKGVFHFDAIRAQTPEAMTDAMVVKFTANNNARVFLQPLNQICFINKSNRLNLRDFKIIYPSHYVQGFVV